MIYEIDRKTLISFTGIMLSWVALGASLGAAAIGWVMLWALIFWRKGKITELFIGFWFVLILSDSLEYQMAFAKTLKNIYILFLAFVLIIDREKFKPMNTIYKRFAPFFIIAVIALLFSPVIIDGAQRTLSYFLIFAIVPNFLTRIYRERGPIIFRELVLFGLAILAFGFLYKYVNVQLVISHGGRLRGFFGNPNGLGLFIIVFFVLFYLVDKTYEGLFSRRFKWLVYGVVFVCVFLSASRNAMISLALFLVFVRFFKVSFGFGLISVLIGLGVYQIISVNIIDIIIYFNLEEYFRVETLEEGSGRFIAWEFAWETIQDHFLLGRGFSYDLHLMRTNFDMLSRAGHEGGVHNSYLILWLNTGLIGVVLYFRAFFLLFFAGSKLNRVAVPGMIAVLFSVFFEPWLAASLNPYTIVLLMIMTIVSDKIFNPSYVEEAEEEEVVDGIELKGSGETGLEVEPI